MSANNAVKIHHQTGHGHLVFLVDEIDAESGQKIQEIGRKTTLVSAIHCANTYMDSNEVEYGLQIKL